MSVLSLSIVISKSKPSVFTLEYSLFAFNKMESKFNFKPDK